MSNFILVNGKYLNMDTVASAQKVGKDRACVTLRDGTEHIVPDIMLDSFDGSNRIVRVIPVSRPLYVIFETEYAATEEVISFLALTESGEVRPLILVSDQYFDFADNAEGYLGIYESVG